MAQMEDDEPARLLAEHKEQGDDLILLNETRVTPKLGQDGVLTESKLQYLDNGVSNHMTGIRPKF